MVDAPARAWVQLSLVKGLGAHPTHTLLTAFGTPEAILGASEAALLKLVQPPLARALKSSPDAALVERILDWNRTDGNHLLTWDDPDYPRMLLNAGEAPLLLYYKGRRELLNSPSLAMVGSRNASPAGIQTAEAFAEALAGAGLTVVSGLALGIDAAAHRGALRAEHQGGSTIAVIGTGIDRIYPPANRDLAHRIAENGGIISEFVLGTPPVAANFPRRNRLISGLTRGVLVVEAALGSGSLITARLAGEQGRDVFAIPGSIHSPFSKGCHKLIKDGAKLVESAQDVLVELRWPMPPQDSNQPAGSGSHPPAAAGADGDALLNALSFDPLTPDELCARLAWPAERVSALLLQLELAGRIAQTPGGRVQRLI